MQEITPAATTAVRVLAAGLPTPDARWAAGGPSLTWTVRRALAHLDVVAGVQVLIAAGGLILLHMH